MAADDLSNPWTADALLNVLRPLLDLGFMQSYSTQGEPLGLPRWEHTYQVSLSDAEDSKLLRRLISSTGCSTTEVLSRLFSDLSGPENSTSTAARLLTYVIPIVVEYDERMDDERMDEAVMQAGKLKALARLVCDFSREVGPPSDSLPLALATYRLLSEVFRTAAEYTDEGEDTIRHWAEYNYRRNDSEEHCCYRGDNDNPNVLHKEGPADFVRLWAVRADFPTAFSADAIDELSGAMVALPSKVAAELMMGWALELMKAPGLICQVDILAAAQRLVERAQSIVATHLRLRCTATCPH